MTDEQKCLEWLKNRRDQTPMAGAKRMFSIAISALEKQEQANTQNINSMRTSRPNALESLNILEQAKDDKGNVPMSLVRQAFRNVIEQAVDKSCKTCKHRKLSAWEKPCNRCYFGSGVLKDYYEPYTEEEFEEERNER